MEDYLSEGRGFVDIMAHHKDAPVPFDYTEKTLPLVQDFLSSLKNGNLEEGYVCMALLAMAVYIGDMLSASIPGLSWRFNRNDKGLLTNLWIGKQGLAETSLWGLVNKAMENRESDSIVTKYPLIKASLSKYI